MDRQSHVEVRLLDSAGNLLAWAPVRVEAGNRELTPLESFSGPGERDGEVATCSVFWPLLHVQQRMTMSGAISKGQAVQFAFEGPVMRFASDEGPLPIITFRAPVA